MAPSSSALTGDLRLAGEDVPFGDALAVVLGYCLGEEPVIWTPPHAAVGGAVHELTRCAFAYRSYDCVPAAAGHRLEASDVLLADGLNAQMRAKDIAGVLAVAEELSIELGLIDEGGTAFWDFAPDEVAAPPLGLSERAWPLWRAWTILMGVDGIDLARTHKILHHKRPTVFPLLDNQTVGLLNPHGSAWATIHSDLTAAGDGWTALEDAVNEVLTAAGGVALTRLRLHDILLWTRATERRHIAAEHGHEVMRSARHSSGTVT